MNKLSLEVRCLNNFSRRLSKTSNNWFKSYTCIFYFWFC